MVFALPFPPIGPDLFSLELGGFTLALRWYALAYIAGLLIGLWLIRLTLSRPALWPGGVAPMTRDQAEALLTWVVLGVVLGGRLGFVLFYQPEYYMANPGEILKIWQGGMAFHGGLAGVAIAGALFCWRHKLRPASVADAIALAAPPGLMLGRLANFVNAELWGRPTTLPWGVIFPGGAAQTCPADWVGVCARHPSQLYQATLEGAILGAVLLWMAFARGALRVPGQVTGVFLAGYGLARFVVEFVRQPDAQFVSPDNPLGLALHMGGFGLTMGQLLSLPMLAAGLIVLTLAHQRRVA